MALKYVVFREIMDQVTGTRGQGNSFTRWTSKQSRGWRKEKIGSHLVIITLSTHKMTSRKDRDRSLNSQEFLIKQTNNETHSQCFGIRSKFWVNFNTKHVSTKVQQEQAVTRGYIWHVSRVKRTRGYLLAEPDLGAGHWPHLPHVALLAAQGPRLAETEIHRVIVKTRHGSC